MTVIERLTPPMNSVVMATWYRTLGINSIHTSIDNVQAYIDHPNNPYAGQFNEVVAFPLGTYRLAKWNGINISLDGAEDPITFNSWLLGGPINTVFIRESFYDLHLIRGFIEEQAGLEPGAIGNPDGMAPAEPSDGSLSELVEGEVVDLAAVSNTDDTDAE